MDAASLFQSAVRGQWENISGQPYQSKTLDVELNLNDPEDKAERWIKVRLLFVRGVADADKAQPGKHDWALFLTTDVGLSPQRIPELYAMRWAIEIHHQQNRYKLGNQATSAYSEL
jgi:hypothetical protein